MSSPFSVFRRNQTVVMAALVVVAIIAFVIAPALNMIMNKGSKPTQNSHKGVLVRWRGGSIDGAHLDRLRQISYSSENVLNRLVREVRKNGGFPNLPRLGPDMNLGLTANQPVDIMRRRFLADKAKEMGIVFDDAAVDSYLRALTNGKVTNARLIEIMREQGNLSKHDFYEYLKEEFSSQVLFQIGYSGFTDGESAIITPGRNWQYFLRFNELAKIEAYPVSIDDFKAEGNPTEKELEALYEKGKNRFAEKYLPDPGFKRRYRADFQFVSASLEKYIKEEVAKLTPEEIQKAYDERIAQNRYQVPDVPKPTETSEGSSVTPPEQGAPPQPTEPNATAPAPAVESQPAAVPPAAPETQAPAEPPKDGQPAPAPGTDPGNPQSRSTTASSIRLVGYQEPAQEGQPPAQDSPAQDSPAQDSQPPADAPTVPPAEVPATGTVPAAEAPQPQAAPAPAATAEQPTVQPTVAPATTNPAPASPPEATAPAGDAATPNAPARPAPPPMRTQSLEEVKEQLMRDLAMPKAFERLQTAIVAVQEKMEIYTANLRQWENRDPSDKTAVKPEPLDLQKLADEHGLEYGTTGMVDSDTVQALPIGRSRVQNRMFEDVALTQGVLPEFAPVNASDMGYLTGGRIEYIFWKTAEKKEEVPSFLTVKKEVEDAWRKEEARKLAAQHAEHLMNQVNENSENPWAALTETQRAAVVTPNAFSWMRASSNEYDYPRLSSVPPLDTPGLEFMKQVFATPTGKATVAPNQPKNVFYVVRVLERLPSKEVLQSLFERTPLQRDSMTLGRMESQNLLPEWYANLEKELNVQWVVPTESVSTW